MPSWTALPFELKYLIFEHFVTSILHDHDLDIDAYNHGTCTTIYWPQIRAWAEAKHVKNLTCHSCEDFMNYISRAPQETGSSPLNQHLSRWIWRAVSMVRNSVEALPDFHECFAHKFEAIKATFETDYVHFTENGADGEDYEEQGVAGLRTEVLKHLCLYSQKVVDEKEANKAI